MDKLQYRAEWFICWLAWVLVVYVFNHRWERTWNLLLPKCGTYAYTNGFAEYAAKRTAFCKRGEASE